YTSKNRHTRCYRNSSSDVCCSDLEPRLRVNGLLDEALAQQLRHAVHIGSLILHVLDTFTELFQKPRNGPVATGRLRGQNVQTNAVAEKQLKLHRVLVGRNLSESRRAVCPADLLKILRPDCHTDGGKR